MSALRERLTLSQAITLYNVSLISEKEFTLDSFLLTWINFNPIMDK